MEKGYPVTFTTNFKGLGLPADLYSAFVTLFEYITEDEADCDNTIGGYCKLPGACESYTAYNDFAFRFNFSGVDDG